MEIARIFDTETTGTHEPQVIEAAWLEISWPSLDVVSRFHQRYMPSKPIGLGAMATHHICPQDLEGCPPHTDFTLPPTTYLVGHKVEFDWAVVGKPEVRLIDTLALARLAWPALDSHTQGALLYHIKGRDAREQLRNAHSADADVEICRQILAALVEVLQPTNWEHLHELSEDALTPKVMPFGKHKDVPVKEVPRDYVRWLLAQENVDHRLRKALAA